ncbi:hypothetical protein Pan181_49470 [Aeoliella mucimassa]|uniref:Uncharacterized protein n=1 Tax=Aeoliella mucimassa TaxID=2527972 RepID=A0A518AVE7_9BACT|nr:hypothetical protein Pan181_49470 [Aeoliella mucimassa]
MEKHHTTDAAGGVSPSFGKAVKLPGLGRLQSFIGGQLASSDRFCPHFRAGATCSPPRNISRSNDLSNCPHFQFPRKSMRGGFIHSTRSLAMLITRYQHSTYSERHRTESADCAPTVRGANQLDVTMAEIRPTIDTVSGVLLQYRSRTPTRPAGHGFQIALLEQTRAQIQQLFLATWAMQIGPQAVRRERRDNHRSTGIQITGIQTSG